MGLGAGAARMTALGAVLAAIGGADLVAGGLAGHPARRWLAGAGAAVAVAFALPALVGGGPGAAALTAVGGGAGAAGWLSLRNGDEPAVARAWWALGWLSAVAGAALLVGSRVRPAADGGVLGRALSSTDAPVLAALPPGRVILFVGAITMLLATANAVVRLVLVTAGPSVVRSADRLRGGRLIGPMERVLLFGFVVAGEPTAAGLVVAAKSLLRFPELASVARRGEHDLERGVAIDPLARVDAVTEYLLVGSLASWTVALAAAALVSL